MSQPNSPQMAEPVALDYARPVHQRGLLPLWVGIVSSLVLSVGVGCTVYGFSQLSRNRSDAHVFIAFGVSFVVFGIGLIASFVVAKR
jgi:hypothetical protein